MQLKELDVVVERRCLTHLEGVDNGSGGLHLLVQVRQQRQHVTRVLRVAIVEDAVGCKLHLATLAKQPVSACERRQHAWTRRPHLHVFIVKNHELRLALVELVGILLHLSESTRTIRQGN